MVPVSTKNDITKVNAAGKVAITATNMLETMTETTQRVREVSDVLTLLSMNRQCFQVSLQMVISTYRYYDGNY